MAYAPYSDRPLRHLKIVIAGGFGTGKTTLVGSVSEIEPLRTEETLTAAGTTVDDLAGISAKRATTVALDFGRITFDDLVLYLFGAPGQERFWYLWSDLARGAAGAVVLVDTRRLECSFTAVDWYSSLGLPFVVGANRFPDGYHYTADEIRDALGIAQEIPVVHCDVTRRHSAVQLLITVVEHSLNSRRAALESHA
ncbi:GTP-binding protein [Streptomyces diastaticus]|uniref:GTP-binding protein n=1 Tax=Streptomyces diastaticus TaxID=1956 RepID=UPI0036664530